MAVTNLSFPLIECVNILNDVLDFPSFFGTLLNNGVLSAFGRENLLTVFRVLLCSLLQFYLKSITVTSMLSDMSNRQIKLN